MTDTPVHASPSPELRVSDVERNQVVEILQRHASEGRLTLDEFSERTGLAFSAKTHSDLAGLTVDLPTLAPDAAVARAAAPAGEVGRRGWFGWRSRQGRPGRPGRRIVLAIMTGNDRKGRWRAGGRIAAIAVMGGIKLDLRRAEIDGDELVITAVAIMGGIHVTVPEGFDVDLSGLPIMGGKQLRLADVPRVPGSPMIRMRAFPVMGGISVRSKR